MTQNLEPPNFRTRETFRSGHGDVAFWRPYVDITLAQAGLSGGDSAPLSGFNSTYPTFICGDVVLKFFGHLEHWSDSYRFERAALDLVSTDPEIAAPELLDSGFLFDDRESGWAWLITKRVPGQAIWRVNPDPSEREAIAADLGQQIQRIHALTSDDVATHADWATVDVTAGARDSSLPPHLVEQVDDYVNLLGPPDPVFINADIVANHVYIEQGRIVGIIDWGDALIADRHIELMQIYRDLFACDRNLFRVFLEASNWPITEDFPRKALAYGLHRQALMKAQHQGGGDVFEPIAERFPLDEIATLDELAGILFDVR